MPRPYLKTSKNLQQQKANIYNKYWLFVVIANNGIRNMYFTGKPIKGLVSVGPDGFDTDKDLDKWLSKGLAYNPFAKSSKQK